MLITHESNRLERLAKAFAQIYNLPRNGALAPEWVVLQNYGMARWLSLQLADQLGIAAHLQFLFPAEFMWGLLRRILKQLPDTAPYSPGVLVWRIYAELEEAGEGYPELAAYLKSADSVRLFELARQLEKVFDQYLLYRPDWIEDWEKGFQDHWQARLWRKLGKDNQGLHWVALQHVFLQRLKQSPPEQFQGLLPQRVSFFGLAELSPGYLRLIKSVASLTDVHFFLMNPCRQYWGDIVTERSKLAMPEEVEPYLEVGNPLLASWGRQGRDFFDFLEGLGKDRTDQDFHLIGGQLLHQIQGDILDLRDRTADPESLTADASVRINNCHTPMRELEVLHDQLLAWFESDPGLTPSDIVVMTPDLERYAPAIEAVFSTAEPRIPYTLADRSQFSSEPLAEIVAALLELPDSRYEVNRILALLEYQPVRQQAGLSQQEASQIGDWCRQTRICWGIDAGMRADLKLPETDEHTWWQGLKRLLLGAVYDSDEPFQGCYAHPELEGSLAVALGRFIAWSEGLFELRSWLQERLPLPEWLARLEALLERMVGSSQAMVDGRQRLRDDLHDLLQQSEGGGYGKPLEFLLVRKLILNCLRRPNEKASYLTGGVTFCALTPMRSIPFAKVCLIGMNDGEFPRPEPRYSFDLSARHYRRGDRSKRLEDRYLFLESLLAARQTFYVSYVGQSVRDNQELSPSVLVSELLDYIERGYGIDRSRLVVRHPLQSFSRRYFEGSQLYTYRDFKLDQAPAPSRPFLSHPLPAMEPTRQLALADLIQFWRHPVRWFCQQRLRIDLSAALALLPEREPFDIARSDRRQLRQVVIDGLRQQQPQAALELRLRGYGLLPHGPPGNQRLVQEIELGQRLLAKQASATSMAVITTTLAGGCEVSGTVALTGEGRRQVLLHSEPYVAEWLGLWLEHLLLCADQLQETYIVYADDKLQLKEFCLKPVPDPVDRLETLYQGLLEGQTRPLRFFPKSAREYAEARFNPRSRSDPLVKARAIWHGNDHPQAVRPEKQDPYLWLVFRGDDKVLDEEFKRWAEEVWGALFQYRKAL